MSNQTISTQKLTSLARAGDVSAQIALAKRLGRKRTRESLLKAFYWYRCAARQGNPAHQMEAGLAMFCDDLSRRSIKEGFAWIERAAAQGIIGAQYLLGSELATGFTVKQDLRQAARWYRRAAEAGHAEAQYNLALMYYHGEGVRKRVTEHRRWLEMAARQRDLLALRRLYEAYRDGSFGYPRDTRKAKYWGDLYASAKV
jgi:TPR repeat protein